MFGSSVKFSFSTELFTVWQGNKRALCFEMDILAYAVIIAGCSSILAILFFSGVANPEAFNHRDSFMFLSFTPSKVVYHTGYCFAPVGDNTIGVSHRIVKTCSDFGWDPFITAVCDSYWLGEKSSLGGPI